MMEPRRALTIPFTVKKDNLMENPLRIPMTCLSSECGKLERQVSWTAFAECKLRHNSQHKNGSITMDCSHAATISLEMTRRKPLLLLTDVLKTEEGKACIERMRKGLPPGSSRERGTPRRRASLQSYSEKKSHVTESRSNGRKSSTPKGRQKTPPQSSRRSNLRRRQQSASDEVDDDTDNGRGGDEEHKDGDKFAEVVDCGLSVTWKPSEDEVSCDEFPPVDIRDKRTEPEKDAQHSSKRKRHDSGSQCNGTSSPKRHRRSVLRLTGEDARDGDEAPAAVCPQDTVEDAELESLDCNIVQFTVGGDDQTQVLLPVNSPSLPTGDVIKSPKRGCALNPENTTEAKASEPIVLSSDEEENENVCQRGSQAAPRRVTVGDGVIQGLSSHKALARRTGMSNLQDIEVLQVVVQDMPHLMPVPSLPDDDYSRIEVAFSALHCGGFHGKSNGDIMIEKQKIFIPLQDASEEMEVILSFNSKELRRYSVWEQHELEEEEICFVEDDDPYPAAVLLFFLTETAAAAVQRDLRGLGFKRHRAAKAGKASPFIVLTLSCPLEGVKGALLRSVLDIECLNRMAQEQRELSADVDIFPGLDDYLSPVLSLEESIELISRTGLDSHLLSMLGLKDADSVQEEDQGSSHCDWLKSPATPIESGVKSPKESTVVEVEFSHTAEQEAPSPLEPKAPPPQEPETPQALEPKASPPQTLGTSQAPELKTSPLQEMDTSSTREPETSLALEPKTSSVPEPESSLASELETSSSPEPETSLTLEPEPALTQEQETSPSLEQETSPAPEISPTLRPEASPSAELETSPSLELKDSLALESETSLSVDLESSPSSESESCPEMEPERSPVLEPETAEDDGTKLKPKQDLKDNEAQGPTCEEEEEEDEEEEEEEEEDLAPVYTLCHRRNKDSYSVSMCKPDSKWTKYKHLGLARRLIQFPPPPQKGGITVTMEDLQCLDNGQFLNDVIIDFYLKYLLQDASASVAERTHIFSSFFYKQLTRRDNASEGSSNESCQRQRRHQRVKTWTRHVDIFKKDFLFVPVNQEAHWYLVVICFPGLDEPKIEDWTGPKLQDEAEESPSPEEAHGCRSSNEAADLPPSLSRSNTVNTQAGKAQEHATKDFIHSRVNCTELTCQARTVCKRPCILVMDSLKLSLHERVVKLLRDYLQSEWEVRRGSSREFGPEQMKSSHCKVPLQDNSSDCGLYLLQYVESFLKDPVVHFELPLCLERWFPRQQVRRKRDDIRDLILYLYRLQNLDLRHMELPSF